MILWKDIPGYPFYQASSDGEIRSIDRVVPSGRGSGFKRLRGRVLKPKTRKAKPAQLPYCDVNLCMNGVPKMETVHKLVALAFHGLKPSSAHEIAHGDNDVSNNRPENIRWATVFENKEDYKNTGATYRDSSKRKRGSDGRYAANCEDQQKARPA